MTAEGNLFSEKGVEMSLCLGNGLCALLELYLNFLSFTIAQEMVLVRLCMCDLSDGLVLHRGKASLGCRGADTAGKAARAGICRRT